MKIQETNKNQKDITNVKGVLLYVKYFLLLGTGNFFLITLMKFLFLYSRKTFFILLFFIVLLFVISLLTISLINLFYEKKTSSTGKGIYFYAQILIGLIICSLPSMILAEDILSSRWFYYLVLIFILHITMNTLPLLFFLNKEKKIDNITKFNNLLSQIKNLFFLKTLLSNSILIILFYFFCSYNNVHFNVTTMITLISTPLIDILFIIFFFKVVRNSTKNILEKERTKIETLSRIIKDNILLKVLLGITGIIIPILVSLPFIRFR